MPLRPGREIVGVEGGEIHAAFLVPDHRAKCLVDRQYIYGTGRRLCRIAVRCRRNRCSSCSHCGHMSVRVDGRNTGIAGRPAYGAVFRGQRQHFSHQIRFISFIEFQTGGRHADRTDVVGIDLDPDDRLLVQIDTAVRGAQTECVVIVPQISAIDGQTIVRFVPCPTVTAVRGAYLQGTVVSSQVIITILEFESRRNCPDGRCSNVRSIDIRSVNRRVRGIDSDRVCRNRCSGVPESMSAAGSVPFHDQVIFASRQRARQDIVCPLFVYIVVDTYRFRDFVSGIVTGEYCDVTMRVCDRFGSVERHTERIRTRSSFRIDRLPIQREYRDVRQIHIVGCGDREGAAVQRRRADDRLRVVHNKIVANKRAEAEIVILQNGLERIRVQLS